MSVSLEACLRGRVLDRTGVSSFAFGSSTHGSCGSSFAFVFSKRSVGFGAVLFGIMRSSPFLLGLLEAPHAPSIYEKRPEVSCNQRITIQTNCNRKFAWVACSGQSQPKCGPRCGSAEEIENTFRLISISWYIFMAEEVGFEPTVRFHARRFSRPVHSTTLPLLRSNLPKEPALILKGVVLCGNSPSTHLRTFLDGPNSLDCPRGVRAAVRAKDPARTGEQRQEARLQARGKA